MDSAAGDVEVLRCAIRVCEEVFGKVWLAGQGLTTRQAPKHAAHPLPIAWEEATTCLDNFGRGNGLLLTGRIAALLQFAEHLNRARSLTHFPRGVPLKKLKEEFASYGFLIEMASRASTWGYPVEFVPDFRIQGQSVPDLRLTTTPAVLFGECKRKDRFVPPPLRMEQWESAALSLFQFIRAQRNNCDVRISSGVPLGEGQVQLLQELILGGMANAVEDRFIGLGSAERGLVVSVRRLPPEDRGCGVYQDESILSYAESVVPVTVGTPPDCDRLQVYPIDAQRAESLASSLDRAHKQISNAGPGTEAFGVVFVDVDLSHVPRIAQRGHRILLELAARRGFENPSTARTAAIVLTSGCLPLDSNEIADFTPAIACLVNPNCTAPPELLAPLRAALPTR